MGKKAKREAEPPEREHGGEPAAQPSPDPAAAAVPESASDVEHDSLESAVELLESSEETVQRLTEELEQLHDRFLRLAAEFDNYRKRMARERSETRARAQAELVSNVLEALDDLSRVTDLEAQQATVEHVVAGVQLVERKLVRELENTGLIRVGEEGQVFDPNDHEAVGTMPAPSGDRDGTVATVLQPGYRFGTTLLRPARVLVYVDQEPSSPQPGTGQNAEP